MMLHKSLLGAAFGLLLLWVAGCKTADGKLTKLGKAYHNVTGRYNAYYHAGLKLTKARQNIDAQYKDNYNELIPLFPYAANQDSNMVKAEVDEAITKCAMNIELHRPSNWADDSYYLLGQAEFLRCKREKAGQTFAYIVAKYNPERQLTKEELAAEKKKSAKQKKREAAKKKKEAAKKKQQAAKDKKRRAAARKKGKGSKSGSKTANNTNSNPNPEPTPAPQDTSKQEKPKKYFLKHRPIHYEATLWMCKAYIETKNYTDAGLYLRLLSEDKKLPHRLRGDVWATTAHLFISQGEYGKAIEPLTKAIKKTRNRKVRTRFTYVLAQLQEKQGNFAAAFENYRKVRRLSPSYEMEFNAQLNAAVMAARGGDAGYNHQLALRRMLNDGKNEEFKDQILFAMAQNQLRDGDKEAGLASLRQAMASSNGGPQKAEIALLLADIYYEQADYINAFTFYDTTCQTLTKTDPRFSQAQSRKGQLEMFATNSLNLMRQDTLLAISKLGFEEQKEYIQRLRKEELAAKNAKPKNGKNAPVANPSGRLTLADLSKATVSGQAGPNNPNIKTKDGQPAVSDNSLATSNFPLYNPNMQKKGEKDFEKKFGQRAWADDWNRSKRAGAENKTDAKTEAATLQPMTEQEVKDMLTKIGVPQDDKQRNELENKIAVSIFNIGLAYREQLNQPLKAIETFEKLLQRFPKSPKTLEAYYMLYNGYAEQRNKTQADYYKGRILSEYPNTDIAKSVQNPNFLNDNAQKEKNLNDFYQQTYDLVRNGKFAEAAQKIAEVSKQFGENHQYKPRFALLEAMVTGGLKGEQDYVKALKSVSTSFPNTNEDKKAKEIVAMLTKGSSPSNGGNTNPNGNPINGKFSPNPNTGHYLMVVFSDKKLQTNPYLTTIADYNSKNYPEQKYTANSFMVDNNTLPAITVRKFKNQDEALRYMEAAKKAKEFLGEKPAVHEIYIISQDNYRTLLQTTTAGILQQYADFHQATYNK